MSCSRKIGPFDCCSVVQGDCLELMRLLPDRCVDAVITDPPYGVLKSSWDSSFDTEWMFTACDFAPILAVMPGTLNLLNLPEPLRHLRYRWCLNVHLINGMTHGKMGYANWFPCVVYAVPETSLYREQSDAVDIAVGTETMPEHPSPKPLKAMEWIVSRFDAETIFDPFLGSGTTAVAAKKLGRHFLGFEISEEYCRIARERISLVEMQPNLFDRQPEQLDFIK